MTGTRLAFPFGGHSPMHIIYTGHDLERTLQCARAVAMFRREARWWRDRATTRPGDGFIYLAEARAWDDHADRQIKSHGVSWERGRRVVGEPCS